MNKVKTVLIALVVAAVAAGVTISVLLAIFLPSAIRWIACTPYGVQCSIGRAKIRLHVGATPDLVIENLTIYEHGGPEPLIRARRLSVAIDPRRLVKDRVATPTVVRIDRPEVRIRPVADGRWNVLALAEVVQSRARRTAGAVPLPLPQVVIAGGELSVGTHRLHGLDLTFEPKSGPLLFDVRAQGDVNGHRVDAVLTLTDDFHGEVLIDGPHVAFPGAPQGWSPRGRARFHLDRSGRQLSIAEWGFEDSGLRVAGTAQIRYAVRPLAYAVTVATWEADLGALAERLPLPEGSALTGRVRGRPTAFTGDWTTLPVASATADLSGIGVHLPQHRLMMSGVKGTGRVETIGSRLRLSAELRGDAADLAGTPLGPPALSAHLELDPRSGAVAIRSLRAALPGFLVQARGVARDWGRGGLDAQTTDVVVEPRLLRRVFPESREGLAVREIGHLSIDLRWPRDGRPWDVKLAVRSIELSRVIGSHGAALREMTLLVAGEGPSLEQVRGTLFSREVAVAGTSVSNAAGQFRTDPESIHVSEFRVVAGGGTVSGRASVSRHSPLTHSSLRMRAEGLRLNELRASRTHPATAPDLTLNADLSATIADGRLSATVAVPPSTTHQIARLLHGTETRAPSDGPKGDRLTLHAQGTVSRDAGLQASASLTAHGLRSLLSGGRAATEERPVTVSATYRAGRSTVSLEGLALSAEEIGPILTRISGHRLAGTAGGIFVSADATLGDAGSPSVAGSISLKALSLDVARDKAISVPFLRGLRGSFAFSVKDGLLALRPTTLRADPNLTLDVGGTISLTGRHDRPAAMRATLPWTDLSVVGPALGAVASAQLNEPRFNGQLRADAELIGQQFRGLVAIRNGGVQSELLRVEQVNGAIPLSGQLGTPSPRNGPPSPARSVVTPTSEDAYERARQRLLAAAAETSGDNTLTVGVVQYGPIELRDLEVSFAAEGDRTTIRQFAAALWNGRIGGWGTVEPLTGALGLTLLAERLSLQAICDAFPPIRGYITGRVNGLARLSAHGASLDRVEGDARFWAVRSRDERKEISRTLIEKLAGQRIRYFNPFGQDRRYDRGVLDVSLRQGDLVFNELDISHTILGFKDLDVRVSPAFNKIGLDHLIEAMSKAIERVKASGQPAFDEPDH